MRFVLAAGNPPSSNEIWEGNTDWAKDGGIDDDNL